MGCGKSKVAPAVTSSIVATRGPGYGTPPPPYEEIQRVPEPDLQTQNYLAFIEFPTPHLLRGANRMYTKMNRNLPVADGELLPYPTPSDKSDVFDMVKYDAIDQYAVKISGSLYQKSIPEFAEYLAKPYRKNQLAMARVVFRWLAAQDVNQYAAMKSLAGDTVAWHLNKIKDNNGYFCDIFIQMCRHLGFQCKLIRGYAKHAHLEPGDNPKEGDKNRWVAIVINDEWRLIDPHWGSSHMVGGGPGEWMLIDDDGSGAKNIERRPEGTAYSYDETYFLTNPYQYIYSHFPEEDADCQLLARQVTLREWVDMAYLKPAFFDLDLRLLEHRKCILYAPDGEIDIQIGTPPGSPRGFMYRLWMSNQQSIDGITFERFCILQQKRNILSCRIYFPVTGKYKLELYGKDSSKNIGGNYYKMICAYIIHAEKPAEGIKALPNNTRTEWGPGHDLRKAGLTPLTHKDAVIEADDGSMEVRFKCERPVEILANLISNDNSKEELEGHILHFMDTEKGEAVVNMRLPESGDYALNLFAKDEGKEGSFPNVCNYIVSTANDPVNPTPFPGITNGRVGPLANPKAPMLTLVSHKSPIITCPDTGEVTLEFKSSVPCETLVNLYHNVGKTKKKMDNYVWTTQENGNKIFFKIIFPEPGVYSLEVFAKHANQEGTFPNVYTCIMDVRLPKPQCMPFPKAYNDWKEGCKLLEPMTRTIYADTKVRFGAVLPQAVDVATISSNNVWTHLTQGSDNVWRGDVDTGDPGTLKFSAKSSNQSNTYSTMLEYQVEEDTKLKAQIEKQKHIEEKAKIENETKQKEDKKEQKKREDAFEKAKQALLKAIETRDLEALKKAVKAVERQKFTSRLPKEYEIAKSMINSLERIRKLNKVVLDLDQNAMLETKNYTNPPIQVHEVITATLLLLGNSETVTKEWQDCKKYLVTIGKDGLQGRIKRFDVTSLNPEISSRSMELIGHYRYDDVNDVSAVAAAFYAWTAGMIEEVQIITAGEKRAPPAGIKRQQEIFSGKDKKKKGRG